MQRLPCVHKSRELRHADGQASYVGLCIFMVDCVRSDTCVEYGTPSLLFLNLMCFIPSSPVAFRENNRLVQLLLTMRGHQSVWSLATPFRTGCLKVGFLPCRC